MSDGWVESVHRSRKDTRTWCKGKVGTSHELVIEIDRRSGQSRCFWTSTYVSGEGLRAHRWSYHCRHIERCVNCLKVMRFFLDKTECPDVHPEPGTDVECRHCRLPMDGHDERGYGTAETSRGKGTHNFWYSGRDGD